jgi:hypothetical protein
VDTTLALAHPVYAPPAHRPPVYQPPAFQWRGELGGRNDAVLWVVALGFAFAAALAWATYCRLSGGYPEIQFGWSGIKVICRK